MSERSLIYEALDDVAGAPRNPKNHDMPAIRASIDRFGFTTPVLRDDRTGRLVVGHGRLEALSEMREQGLAPPAGVRLDELGRWLVPVIAGWSSNSDAEAEAYLVTDNQLTLRGGWDAEALTALLSDLDVDLLDVTGFAQSDLDDMLAMLAPPDLDTFAAGVGEPADGAGWPTLHLKVPHHVAAAWQGHLDAWNDDVPAAFAALLGVGPTPPDEHPDDVDEEVAG